MRKHKKKPLIQETVNLDDLDEYSSRQSQLKTFIKNKKKSLQKAKQKKLKEKLDPTLYNFQTDFFKSLILKVFSLYAILVIVEIALGLFLDMIGVDGITLVSDPSFKPYVFEGGQRQLIYKFLWVSLAAYFTTPNIEVQATKKGLRVNKSLFFVNYGKRINWITYKGKIGFIEWSSIKRVHKGLMILSPCIYLYDEDDNMIGHIFFSLKNKDSFFQFVKEYAGESHPLYRLSKK